MLLNGFRYCKEVNSSIRSICLLYICFHCPRDLMLQSYVLSKRHPLLLLLVSCQYLPIPCFCSSNNDTFYLFRLQLHVLGSEDSPAASPLSPLHVHILKNFVTSVSAPAYFSSLECSYLQPKTETPLGQSLLQSQTVWNSKLQPKDALFVADMTTFLMKNQKHCVLLSRYIPVLDFNLGVSGV